MTALTPRTLWFGVAVALRVGSAIPALADCPRTCGKELVTCKRTQCGGMRGGGRRRCLANCRGASGCGGGSGTLAYVVSTCRVQGDTQIGAQELRIRRGGCDPVTVVRFSNPEPVADPFGICTSGSKNHAGNLSPIAGVFQRLGVSGNGSSVVFEISNQFQLIGRTELAPERQGFFWVRADGTGLRRLAPPSRDSVYRIVPDPPGTTRPGGLGVYPNLVPKLAISENGRRIAYSDRGPAASGREAEQLFTLDVVSGERRQVTRFEPAGTPRDSPHPLLWFIFLSSDTIGFEHPTPDVWESWLVNFDGSNLTNISGSGDPIEAAGGRIEPRFGVTSRRPFGGFLLFTARVPGKSENFDIFPCCPIKEIFYSVGPLLIQLTNFRRWDTEVMGARNGRVLFLASGDPHGTNPFQNCQLFRVSLLGENLRQLTRFGTGERSMEGCNNLGETPGCSLQPLAQEWFATRSRSLPFYSDCDPFGTNPDGSQVFAIDYDGRRLRQLTHTAGARTAPDGALEVEIPGPVAIGGR